MRSEKEKQVGQELMKEALKLKSAQMTVKRELEEQGITFEQDGYTVQLAESIVNEEHLNLCMRCQKNEGNQLVYVLFEKNGDIEYGVERHEQFITDRQIKDMSNSIDNIIKSFTGIYDKQVATIKINIYRIHTNRLLKGIRSINTEKIPMIEIIHRLRMWILLNASDCRIGIMTLHGVQRIAIICPKGYKSGIQVGGIFQQIFQQIAPGNNYGAFKAELMRRNLLFCDKNEHCLDIQKTISKAKCVELKTEHVKVICFNFEESFVKQVIAVREEYDIVGEISDDEVEAMFNEGDYISSYFLEEDMEAGV